MIDFIKKRTKLLEVILLFFFSLTPLLWLRQGEIILGHDAGFRLDPIQHLVNLFYSWDTSANFGIDWSVFKGFLVTQTPEAFLIALTNSFALGQKLTFIFWFFSIGVSMYVFINSLFKRREYWFFRMFASAFYMYNFFLLQGWFIAERAKFSLFCAIPLGVLSIYKTLTGEYSILKGLILFSLVSLLLNAGGSPTFYGTLLLVYGITFIYLTAVNIGRKGYREIAYSLKVGSLFAVVFLTVNAYWILPQVYSFLNGYGSNLLSVGGIESVIKWESVITQNASFINLLRLQGIPDWYDNNLHTYGSLFVKNPLLIILSFIPFFILLFGLMYHKKLIIDGRSNKFVILVLLFLLFGLFFTAGSHPPFGQIYVLFIKYIPGFAIFRSAFYKFGAVLWFSYIFIVSFYLNLFLSKTLKNRKTYIFLTIFSFCFLLAYHFPFFNSNFFIWNKPFTTKLTVPSYVTDMTDYINKMPSNTRILLLPEFDHGADSYQWGFWGIDSLPRLLTNRSIIANSSNSPEIIGSIYYSISQNEENTFLRLVGVSGITKVLWRDDVLYSDKERTSQNFGQIRENLENFEGVTLEKKIGAWSLYEIKSPYHASIIHSIDSIVYAQSDLPKLRSIFSREESSGNVEILFDELMEDMNREILLSSSKNVIGAACIACGSENFSQAKGGLLMPELKILPTSPFYYLSVLREQQVRELHKNNPELRIDADLGYSNKRIVEMKEIANAKVRSDKDRFFVNEAIKKYKTLITDAVGQAGMLAEDKENKALMKTLIYLNSQFWFLGMQENLYDYALEDFEELSIFMQEKIKDLGSKIWATDFTENKIRYLFSLNNPGIYDLNVVAKDMQVGEVEVDGKSLTEFKNLTLDKGTHRIEISYPVSENLIDINEATGSGELRLKFGERAKFSIKNFNPKETYFVSFDYKISQGRPNASIIEKEKIKTRVWNLLLNQNNVWNSFNSIFEPNVNTQSVNLEFYLTGFETTGGTIQLKNLKIISVSVPEVFVSVNLPASIKNESLRISFDRFSPTAYKINVEGSVSPFVLAFGDSYSKGWRAYIVEEGKKERIPEAQHYILNGYSNGWLVDKKGNYPIVVEYFPQKIFYAGLIISGISILALVSIWLKRKENYE